jgi:hypothetical protein
LLDASQLDLECRANFVMLGKLPGMSAAAWEVLRERKPGFCFKMLLTDLSQ